MQLRNRPDDRITGGGLEGELSNFDLDVRMLPSFPNYVEAVLFYEVRQEEDPAARGELAERLVARLHAILDRHACAIMPVHVRYHWTTAVVRRVQGRLVTVVYDSARHPATARDINFHFTRDLGLGPPTIVAHAKQRRGSAECGLHVFLIGAWAAYGTRPLPQAQLAPPDYISLHGWRALLAGGQPLTRGLTTTLMGACGDAAALIGFGAAVRGGAGRSGAARRSVITRPAASAPFRIRAGPAGPLLNIPTPATAASPAATPTAPSLSTDPVGHLRYAIRMPRRPQPPPDPRTRAQRAHDHSERAQLDAAASWDPGELQDDFLRETPVPLAWFLSRATAEDLDAETVELVRAFYAFCTPAQPSFARLTSDTADPTFWALHPTGDLIRKGQPLRHLFGACAARLLASDKVHLASVEDRQPAAYSAFTPGSYLTNTAVDRALQHALLHSPPSTGWSYLPSRVLSWWHGRQCVPRDTL